MIVCNEGRDAKEKVRVQPIQRQVYKHSFLKQL